MDRDYKHIVDVALVYFQGSAKWLDPEGKDIYSPGGVRYREEKAKSETWAKAAQYLWDLMQKEDKDDVPVSKSDSGR